MPLWLGYHHNQAGFMQNDTHPVFNPDTSSDKWERGVEISMMLTITLLLIIMLGWTAHGSLLTDGDAYRPSANHYIMAAR
jgi:hypothetical protein